MSDRMDERDRAKRALLLRLMVYLGVPVVGLVVCGLVWGPLWALAGLVAGVLVAMAVARLLPRPS